MSWIGVALTYLIIFPRRWCGTSPIRKLPVFKSILTTNKPFQVPTASLFPFRAISLIWGGCNSSLWFLDFNYIEQVNTFCTMSNSCTTPHYYPAHKYLPSMITMLLTWYLVSILWAPFYIVPSSSCITSIPELWPIYRTLSTFTMHCGLSFNSISSITSSLYTSYVINWFAYSLHIVIKLPPIADITLMLSMG